MKEQIKQIIYKYFPHAESYKAMAMISDLEKLFRDTYLDECIEKATPNLSKIEDVDKELSKIKGADNCDNCFFEHLNYWNNPCDICNDFDKWEPKTE